MKSGEKSDKKPPMKLRDKMAAAYKQHLAKHRSKISGKDNCGISNR